MGALAVSGSLLSVSVFLVGTDVTDELRSGA